MDGSSTAPLGHVQANIPQHSSSAISRPLASQRNFLDHNVFVDIPGRERSSNAESIIKVDIDRQLLTSEIEKKPKEAIAENPFSLLSCYSTGKVASGIQHFGSTGGCLGSLTSMKPPNSAAALLKYKSTMPLLPTSSKRELFFQHNKETHLNTDNKSNRPSFKPISEQSEEFSSSAPTEPLDSMPYHKIETSQDNMFETENSADETVVSEKSCDDDAPLENMSKLSASSASTTTDLDATFTNDPVLASAMRKLNASFEAGHSATLTSSMAKFYSEAANNMENIRENINDDLPDTVGVSSVGTPNVNSISLDQPDIRNSLTQNNSVKPSNPSSLPVIIYNTEGELSQPMASSLHLQSDSTKCNATPLNSLPRHNRDGSQYLPSGLFLVTSPVTVPTSSDAQCDPTHLSSTTFNKNFTDPNKTDDSSANTKYLATGLSTVEVSGSNNSSSADFDNSSLGSSSLTSSFITQIVPRTQNSALSLLNSERTPVISKQQCTSERNIQQSSGVIPLSQTVSVGVSGSCSAASAPPKSESLSTVVVHTVSMSSAPFVLPPAPVIPMEPLYVNNKQYLKISLLGTGGSSKVYEVSPCYFSLYILKHIFRKFTWLCGYCEASFVHNLQNKLVVYVFFFKAAIPFFIYFLYFFTFFVSLNS